MYTGKRQTDLCAGAEMLQHNPPSPKHPPSLSLSLHTASLRAARCVHWMLWAHSTTSPGNCSRKSQCFGKMGDTDPHF